VPSGFREVTRTDVPGAVAHVTESTRPDGTLRYSAKGYRSPKCVNPDFFYGFKNEGERDAYLTRWFDGLAERIKVKAGRTDRKRELAALPNPIKVGDIFHYSWGYDQTNCEFYEVVTVKGKSVGIRRICGEAVPGSGSFMSERLTAKKGEFHPDFPETLGKVVKMVDGYGSDSKPYPALAMDHGTADLWDGKPCYSSWYA
jgi:hypothetical protein